MQLQDVTLTPDQLEEAQAYNYERWLDKNLCGMPWPFLFLPPGEMEGTIATVAYQVQEGLVVDGKLGPATEEVLRGLSCGGTLTRFPFVRIPTEQYNERGYDNFRLRQDAAESFLDAKKVLDDCGVVLTSSGGRRSLHADVTANRAATSMHYLGRAFDLYVYSGMTSIDSDPFLVEYEGARNWRLWARCSRPDNIPSDYEGNMTFSPATWEHRKGDESYRILQNNYLDFTALMQDHGFERISARKAFFKDGSRGGAEWWHFQYEIGLVAGETTFGSELLRVYTQDELEGTPPWEYRDYVWNGDGGWIKP